MTRVQVTTDHTRRSDPSPALPPPIPELAVTAEETVTTMPATGAVAVAWRVEGSGHALLERWLRHRPWHRHRTVGI